MKSLLPLFVTLVGLFYIKTQSTYDPCIYVNSSNSPTTRDTCVKAGDCCAFKFSYKVDFTTDQKVDFYSCVSRQKLLAINPNLQIAYLSGIDDETILNDLRPVEAFGEKCFANRFVALTFWIAILLLMVIV